MSKQVDYSESIVKAFKLLFGNLKLFFPDIVFVIISTIFLVLFVVFNFWGVLQEVLNGVLFENALKSWYNSGPLFRAGISFAILIVANILIGLGTVAARYAMIRAVIKGEKITFKKVFKEARKYWVPIFFIKLMIFLLIWIPIAIVAGIFGLLIGISKGALFLLIPFGVLAFFAIIAYAFYIRVLVLFTYPVLTFDIQKHIKNLGVIYKNYKSKNNVLWAFIISILVFVWFGFKIAVKTLKEVYKHYNINKKRTWLTFIIVLAISLASSFVSSGISSLGGLSVFFIPILILFIILRVLFNIAVKLWGELFIFEKY